MTQDYKRIAKNTIFLYFRMIITMVVSFYTVRIVLDSLGVIDYGLYNLVASFVVMMTFLNATLTSGTQRFLTFEIGKNNFRKLKQIFSTTLILHGAIALLILLLGETVGLWFLYEKMNIPAGRFDAAFWAYQFAILSTMISVTQVPYNALIIAHEKMHIYAYVSIIEVVLKLLIVYLLYISPYDKLITYGFLLFVVSSAIAMFYRWYVTKQYSESHFEYSLDKEIIKPLLHFSGWNLFGSISGLLSTSGIAILLNIYFGPIANAAYAIALQVNTGLGQFVNNFQTAMTPQITKLYASDNISELNHFLQQNSKFAYLLLWVFVLPIYLKLQYVLSLWLNEVPTNTMIFIKLLLVYSLQYAFMRPLVLAIQATGKVKGIQLTAGILLLMILPISYILLENGFPIYSPFLVMICMWVPHILLEFYFLKKYINFSTISFIRFSALPVAIVSILSGFILNYLSGHFENSFLGFISFIILSVILQVALIYYLAMDRQTRLALRTKIWSKIISVRTE